MPVLAEIIAWPVLTAAAAIVGAQTDAAKPADPCRAPAIRLESANLATLPGPNSPMCMEARKARDTKEPARKDPLP
jgi:hypothetical protein